MLRAFRDLARVAPRELTLWAHVLHFPPWTEVPEPMRGRSFVNVAATYIGSPKMAEILLWSLRDAAPVEIDLMGPFHAEPARRGGGRAVRPDAGAWSTRCCSTDLDDAAIDALVAAVSDPARAR